MPSTVTRDAVPDVGDGRSVRVGTISLGIYATNGIAVTPAQLGFTTLVDLDLSPAGGYVPEWNKAAGLVLAYYGDNNNAADGPLIEVPNAVDLSAFLFRFRARGA